MSNYRRIYVKGGTYFFTLVTRQRKSIFDNSKSVSLLHAAFEETKNKKPFSLNAIVILPDHLHCIWTLKADDDDFSVRWQMIKARFSRLYNKHIAQDENIWQPRFWEHLIRDENDLKNHIDYIHYNPVKHGLVNSPREWKYSTYHKYVLNGFYDESWGRSMPEGVATMEFE